MSITTAMGWMLHTLAGGGLLLLLAWVWTAWTRQPARRLRVAEWAVAASLVLAVLSLGPAWLVVATPAPASPSVEEPPPNRGAPAPPVPVAPPPTATVPLVPPLVSPAPAEPAPDHPPATTTDKPAWKWDADRIAPVAAGAYLAVVAALLGRWLLGWFALRRLLRRCEPVRARAAERFAEMAGVGRRPRLLASRQARAPFSCGVLRPTVVLPAELCETASDEVLRRVFAHELAHLERRDAWSGLLFGLAQALYFPVPWFWRLRRQARLCQEYLADAAATAAGGRPEDYAQFLLAWTAALPPPFPPPAGGGGWGWGACGVWGRSSDLYWRVKTMLQNPVPLERRCPRRWSLAAACGLLSLAVLAAGVTLKATAAPAPEPPKEEPKPAQPKADQPAQPPDAPDLALPNLDDLLKNLQNLQPLDPVQAEQLRAQMEQTRERMRQLQKQFRGVGVGAQLNPLFPATPAQTGRLGAVVEKPGDTLVDQLELPKDQGLILREVAPDSAAAKAGLKAHDILLEMDGKPVSSDPAEFRKTLDGVKADTPVDVVVLRKGKKETVKGLSLPEAKAEAPVVPGFNPVAPVFPPNFPNLPILPPNFPILGQGAPNNSVTINNGVIMTTSRNNDQFTTQRMEPGLILSVKGKMEDGKARVSEITVQDATEIRKYDSVDKVPEQYRDKVKNLVRASEKGEVKAETNAP